ncbi:RNA polymerase sigma-70 factor [candidate division WOR-3 bacterium]|nr:RNA polymerase sigma-70 factor [candidate division WOR-3 bacterium]
MNEIDEKLIADAAKGDAEAFERLVKRYQRQVLSTAYRYVGDTTTAEDLTQEVFIKVWEKAGSFKGRSKFTTWLYRIVVNHCLNYQERRKRRKLVGLNELVPDEGPGIEEKIEKRRKAQVVREAVAELPERQRIALILSRFEGYSYAEIAKIMKVSVSSVESLIFRAKDNLRKQLTPFREKGIV